eukprot:TRINITY_DN4921_c0_g1_i1.p2 TRINITY_DN4921_c0_g1~~TRINITY_DN4921_c0_g1_i1.p2  ORF type:complete len:112 (+),score=32.18 TRINITY_DN4921_c0_g1_i1:35-370(+)
MATQTPARQLVVKTNTLKRNVKDLKAANKEVDNETTRLEKFRSEGRDDAAIRQQENCIAEARQMVPEAKKRITKAAAELREFLAGDIPAEVPAADIETARATLAEAEEALA